MKYTRTFAWNYWQWRHEIEKSTSSHLELVRRKNFISLYLHANRVTNQILNTYHHSASKQRVFVYFEWTITAHIDLSIGEWFGVYHHCMLQMYHHKPKLAGLISLSLIGSPLSWHFFYPYLLSTGKKKSLGLSEVIFLLLFLPLLTTGWAAKFKL